MAEKKDSEFPRWYYPPEAQPDSANGGGVLCYSKSDIPKGFKTMQAKPKETSDHDL